MPQTEPRNRNAGQRQPPTHNWRPTVVHGAAVWVLLGAALLLPLEGPLALGIGIVGLVTAPVFPVGLYCDYRQAQTDGECAPGVKAYLRNLGHDVVTRFTSREPLGSARGAVKQC